MTTTAVDISEKELLLSVLNSFLRLQEERVQVCFVVAFTEFLYVYILLFVLFKVYKEYDGTLKSLIEQNLISQYSENCRGATTKFSLISNKVISLQVENRADVVYTSYSFAHPFFRLYHLAILHHKYTV